MKLTNEQYLEHISKRRERQLKWFENARVNSKFYDINPYLEVFQTRENIYSLFAECTHDKGDTWMHLIVGPEKALLVDSGFGLGDLKGFCEMLSGGKPVIVANTHCHGDHAGGNSQFGEAYCHEYEAPMMEYQQYPEFWNEFNHVGESVAKNFYKFEDIIPFKKYDVLSLKNHHKFDLGAGYIVELIHVPGHTPGGAVYLDRQARIAFTGDALMPVMHTFAGPLKPYYEHQEFGTLRAWKDGLKTLWECEQDFDYIFSGHGDLDVSKDLCRDLITGIEEIVADPESYEAIHAQKGTGKKLKYKICGLANILYVDSRI